MDSLISVHGESREWWHRVSVRRGWMWGRRPALGSALRVLRVLFACFVNDLSGAIQTETLMFADDVKVYRRVGG